MQLKSLLNFLLVNFKFHEEIFIQLKLLKLSFQNIVS